MPLWTSRPRPLLDESFSSWFYRLSYANGLAPADLYRVALPGAFLHSRDLDRHACLNLLSTLSERTDVPVEALEKLTFSAWCGTFNVPRWENGDDYAIFLAGCATQLGFPDIEPWTKSLPIHFHAMSEGLTGETWRLMWKVAEVAKQLRLDRIDETVLRSVDWRRPSERRKAA